MTTATENIVAAVAALLTSSGVNVRADTEELYSFENLPCVLIDCGDEYPDPVVGMGFIYWNLAVMVLIGADGPVPKLAPEITRKAVHEALYADRTLGGLVIDVWAGPINRGIDAENPALGITQVTYNLKYRVLENTA